MPKALRYILRLLWFLAKHAAIILIVVSLVYMAFYYGMNVTNIFVLVKEGMQKRAAVVMNMKVNNVSVSASDLAMYFYKESIKKDTLLNDPRYENFEITDFMHDIEMENISVTLRGDTATAVIKDRVWTIYAKSKDSETGDEAEGSATARNVEAPEWENARYKVTLKRTNNVWRIYGLEKLEDIVLPKTTPQPTSAGEASARPSFSTILTPTPSLE